MMTREEPITQGVFVEEPRLTILKAVQNGEKEKVSTLLSADPTLIGAKTKSKGSSLLHIAAQYGHIDMCKLLLASHHETNPVNFDGVTPYKTASSYPIIQRLLVDKHAESLHKQLYKLDTLVTSIQILPKAFTVLNRNEFITRLRQMGSEEMSDSAFAMTEPFSKTDEDRCTVYFDVYFREDVFMNPYYGPILVIHEYDLARHHIEQWEQYQAKDLPFEEQKAMIDHLMPMLEARAFMTGIAYGLREFEFLRQYPKPSTVVGIEAETYNMFNAFCLVGLASYLIECQNSEDQSMIDYLKSLPLFGLIANALSRISPENIGGLRSILLETQAAYIGLLPSDEEASQPNANGIVHTFS